MAMTGRRIEQYNVGGVLLPRPFKIRRLGHFGFNVEKLDECYTFYHDYLGFKVSDLAPFKRPEGDDRGPTGYFMHHGGDHHSFVIFDAGVMNPRDRGPASDITINQITWQVGSLEEVVKGAYYFKDHELSIRRIGRDMPGSNWHVYLPDPDGHVNELYYGIEQVGWLGHSKPQAMYYRGFREEPPLPQASEVADVQEALRRGIDIYSGYRDVEAVPATYAVEGVLLPRPFKVTRIGPVNLFVQDVDQARRFYMEHLGLTLTEEASYQGQRIVFLRSGTEHHSLGLFPRTLRESLGCSPHTSCASFGLEVGSYQQLRAAVAFLKERGVKFLPFPAELHPGVDFAAYAIDPEGHCLQLYYYMEQIGWDGRPRPASQRRQVAPDVAANPEAWPEALEPLSDTYYDQTFLGPLG